MSESPTQGCGMGWKWKWEWEWKCIEGLQALRRYFLCVVSSLALHVIYQPVMGTGGSAGVPTIQCELREGLQRTP